MQKRNEIVLKDYISKYNLLQSEKTREKILLFVKLSLPLQRVIT